MAHVREAETGDAAAIAGVHVRSFLSTYGHLPITRHATEGGFGQRIKVWVDRLDQPGVRTLVAIEQGEVVGFVHVGPSPDQRSDPTVGHIHSIHVEPELTGMGIGGRLLGAARNALIEDGYCAATLWAVADNKRALRFYARLGWRPDGGRRREHLAVGEEEGDEVEVVRYRLDLGEEAEQR